MSKARLRSWPTIQNSPQMPCTLTTRTKETNDKIYSNSLFGRLPEEVDGVYPACAGFDLLHGPSTSLNIFVKEILFQFGFPSRGGAHCGVLAFRAKRIGRETLAANKNSWGAAPAVVRCIVCAYVLPLGTLSRKAGSISAGSWGKACRWGP